MATLTFTGYQVTDGGTTLTFLDPDPASSGRTDSFYTIMITDTELSAVTTQAQLRTLVTQKLQRKLQAAGIASKLDNFVGQSITI